MKVKKVLCVLGLCLISFACTKAQRARIHQRSIDQDVCFATADKAIPQMKQVRDNQDSDAMLGFVMGGIIGGTEKEGFSAPHALLGAVVGNAIGSDDEVEGAWNKVYTSCLKQRGFYD